MENLSWAVPILPGKLEAWHSFNHEMQSRWDEHTASRREMGIHREVASLMETPAGPLVCLYHEADDLAAAFRILATSETPYPVWFREKGRELHGLTVEMLLAPPPAEVKIDYRR